MASYDETHEALATAFVRLAEADEVDVSGDDAAGIDVIADAWTFHAEGWPGPALAWLAHDDEPDSYDDQTIQNLFPAAVLTAFSAADRTLAGALATALRASDDPLSSALADGIA